MKSQIGWVVLSFLLVLTLWEIGSRQYTGMIFVLPPPSSILLQIWERSDRFLFHMGKTFQVMSGGFFLALFAAFPLAWIMTIKRSACLMLQPLFLITQCVPMFALAPIMVFWFGWSYTAIVVPTALMIFFPLTMNIYQGLRSTPPHLVNYFSIHHATAWQTLFKLQLPWALPHLFAGFRISAAIAGIGAIAGEWAGAQSGLGLLMLESRRGADLEMMFGALVCLLIISLSLYAIISIIERMMARHKFVHLIRKGIPAILIAMGISLSGCQSSSSTTAQTRLVLDWLPNPNHVPLYVGVQKGFFAKHDINLQILVLHDVGGIHYLSSGQTDLALYYMPSSVRALARGAKIKPIAVLIPEPLNALIFRKNAKISSPQDINGKIVGYCVDGSSTHILDHILTSNQIVPKEKLNVSFDLASTLGTEQVDVIYGAFWNIECEQLRSLGIETSHFSLNELGVPNYYEEIIIAREGSLEDTESFIARFQSGLQESIDFCKSNPEQAFEIYTQENPDKSKSTLKWEKEAWQKTIPLLASNQQIDQSTWKAFEDWLHENHLLKR